MQIELTVEEKQNKHISQETGHFQAYQVFVNKVSFASFINSIKRRINWPKLCTRASPLPNLLPYSLPSDCARALPPPTLPLPLAPPLFTSNLFSPPLLLLTLTVYFPFTLFAPLIFHSAWRLSWNLVNTGKLKTSSKGPFHTRMLLRFPEEKKFHERPYTTFIDALIVSTSFETRIPHFCKPLCFCFLFRFFLLFSLFPFSHSPLS